MLPSLLLLSVAAQVALFPSASAQPLNGADHSYGLEPRGEFTPLAHTHTETMTALPTKVPAGTILDHPPSLSSRTLLAATGNSTLSNLAAGASSGRKLSTAAIAGIVMSVVVGIAIIMGIVMCALYMRNEKKHREVWVEPKSHRRYSGASRDSFASDLSNASTATFVNDVDIDRNVSKYLNLVRTPTLESMQSYATGSTEVGNVVGTPPKWYTYMESQKKTKAGAGIADRVAPPAPTLPPTATAARSRALPIPPSRPRTGYKHHYNRPPPGIRPLAPPHLVAQPQPTRVYGPGTRQPPRNLQQFTAYRAPSNLNAAPPAYTAYTYTHANTTANAHAGTHAITTNAASPAMPVAVRLPRIVPVATTPPGQRSAHPQHGNLRVHIATPVRSPESPSPLSPMMLAAFPRSPHTPVGEVRARSTRDVVTHRPNRSDVTFTVMTVGPRDSIVESYSYADDYHGF